MKTLSDLFPKGTEANPDALKRLMGAYERVFFGRGATNEDQQLVLSDLATFTRNFFVDGANATDEEIREANGMRLVMARIIRLGLSEKGDLTALYKAAVRQTATNKENSI